MGSVENGDTQTANGKLVVWRRGFEQQPQQTYE